MLQDQKDAFLARVARIQTGGLHTNRTLFVGMDEAIAVPKKGSLEKIAGQRAFVAPWMRKKTRRSYSLLPALMALALGMIAFPLVLLGTLNPAAGPQMASAPGGPLGAAVALALVTAFVIGLRTPVALVATAAGVLAMATGFHNVVHAAPEVIAQVFPDAWVATTLSTTEMGTLQPLSSFFTL